METRRTDRLQECVSGAHFTLTCTFCLWTDWIQTSLEEGPRCAGLSGPGPRPTGCALHVQTPWPRPAPPRALTHLLHKPFPNAVLRCTRPPCSGTRQSQPGQEPDEEEFAGGSPCLEVRGFPATAREGYFRGMSLRVDAPLHGP